MEERMDFSDALRILKDGRRVRRTGWSGTGLTFSNEYTGMWTAQGHWQVGWRASQADLLAEEVK